MATVDSAASATTHTSNFRDGAFPESVMFASYEDRLSDRGGRLGMSDGRMAARALQPFGLAVNHVAVDRGGDVFMTSAACVLDDSMIEFRDLDGVRIPAGREVKGMPEAVVGFHRILPENIVGSVAIVAGGRRAMAGFQPGIILGAHHMTIRAGSRVIGEIGITLGVNEGEAAEPDHQAQGHAEQQGIAKRGAHSSRMVLPPLVAPADTALYTRAPVLRL